MADIVIDYNEIIEAIEEQFSVVFNSLAASSDSEVKAEMAKIKQIVVSDEQNFVKKKKVLVQQGYVYIVIKFGSGSINYASSVCPISISCMGTANEIRPTQLLLGVFASTWTTKNLLQDLDGEISNVLQVWNTPEVLSNFSETNIEFRNLLVLRGNIVIGPEAVRLGTLTYIYDEDAEEEEEGSGSETVNIMSFQDGYRASLDSQPFGNTNGFVKSEVNFSTYTFSIGTYLLDNHLSADLLAIRGFRNRNGGTISSTFSQNDYMKLKLEFTNGFDNIPSSSETTSDTDPVLGSTFYAYYKVVDSRIAQELAGIPSLTITFTR